MNNVILNERACAEYAIDNFNLGSNPVSTLGLVARYYYSIGYKKKDVGKFVEDFMIKCDPSINIVKWQGTIDRLVKASDKYNLVDIAGISVTQTEIEKIQNINGRALQRLMFTMLCLAKYGNAVNKDNNNWVNRKDKDIFTLANIATTVRRQSLMINDLWQMQYIGYSRVVDNININVKIIDNQSPEVLFINDFRNLGNQYMRYCGENFFECQCCGKVIKKSRNAQKYCPECAVEINRQKTLEQYHKNVTS